MSANDSVANLLLQIRGDNEADDDLARLQAQLEMFDSTDAEATAKVKTKGESDLDSFVRQVKELDLLGDVDVKVKANTRTADRDLRSFWRRNQTALFEWAQGLKNIGDDMDIPDKEVKVKADVHPAQMSLHDLNDQLRLFDENDAEAFADVNTIVGTTKLQRLMAKLREFGRSKATAEADVDRDGRATASLSKLRDAFVRTAFGARAAEEGSSRLRASFLIFSGLSFQAAVAVYALAAALAVALGAALAAIVASLAAAAAGMAALGIAAAAAIGPIAAIVGFAIFRFLDLKKKGGEVAQELQRAFKQTGDVLQRTLSPTVRPIFRALTAELRAIRPAIEGLRPAFTVLGQAGAEGIKIIGSAIQNLAPRINQLIAAASPLITIFAQMFEPIASIILDIANAAMPYLISGLQKVRDALQNLAADVSMADLNRIIGGLVEHTKSWFNLFGAVGRLVLNFFGIAAPQGKELVDALTDIVNRWADWIAANPDKVRDFLKNMIDISKEVAAAVADIVVAIVAFAVAVGPALAIVLPVIASLITLFAQLLGAINSLPPALQVAASFALLFLGPIGIIRVLIGMIRLLAFTLGAPLIAGIARALASFAILGASMIATGAKMGASLIGGLLAGLAPLGGRISAFIGASLARLGPGLLTKGLVIGAALGQGITNALFVFGAKTLPGVIGRWLQVSIGGPLGTIATVFGIDLAKVIGNGFTSGWEAVKGIFRRKGGEVNSIFRSSLTGLKGSATRSMADVASAIEQGANRFTGAIHRGMSGTAKAIEEGASKWGDAIDKGVSDAVGAATAGGAKIAAGMANGVNTGRPRAQAAGSGLGQAVANGIGGAVGAVTAGAAKLAASAQGPIRAAAGSASSAGVAFGTNFANGIASTASAVAAGAAKIAAAARAKLPGSEPRDRSSPLFGLADAGKAVVVNMARGLKAAGPMLINALDDVLTQIGLRIDRLQESSTKKALKIRQSLEAMIPKIEKLKAFQEAVLELGSTMQDVANRARDAWIDVREQFQLAALAGTPEGQELAALLGEQKTAGATFELRGMEEEVSDAQSKLADLEAEKIDPLRTRPLHDIEAEIVATERAIRDANDRIAQFKRQQRIDELQSNIDTQTDIITKRAEIARQGFDAEANAYRDSLNTQFQALEGMLARGEISYATFVRRVNKILGPLASMFEMDPRDEVVLRGGRNFINAFIEGMNSMRGKAKKILAGILQELRDMLPGSEPRDRKSPLLGLAAPGKAAMENLATGIERGGDIVLRSLYAELAPIPAIAPDLAVNAKPVGAGIAGAPNIINVERNYNLPPGPGGGYEPMFAASQLDKLMQDEGGWR